jgi:hypothetical protein
VSLSAASAADAGQAKQALNEKKDTISSNRDAYARMQITCHSIAPAVPPQSSTAGDCCPTMGDIFHPSGGMQYQQRQRYASAPYNNRTQYNEEEDGEFFTGEGYEEVYQDEHGLYTGAGFDNDGCEVPVMTGAKPPKNKPTLEQVAKAALKRSNGVEDKNSRMCREIVAYSSLCSLARWWLTTPDGYDESVNFHNIVSTLQGLSRDEAIAKDAAAKDSVDNHIKETRTLLQDFMNRFPDVKDRTVSHFKKLQASIKNPSMAEKSMKKAQLEHYTEEKRLVEQNMDDMKDFMNRYFEICKFVDTLKTRVADWDEGVGFLPQDWEVFAKLCKEVQHEKPAAKGNGQRGKGRRNMRIPFGTGSYKFQGEMMSAPYESRHDAPVFTGSSAPNGFCQCGPHAIPVPMYSGADICECDDPIPVLTGVKASNMNTNANDRDAMKNLIRRAMAARHDSGKHKNHPSGVHHSSGVHRNGKNPHVQVHIHNNHGRRGGNPKNKNRGSRRMGSEFDDQQHDLEYPISYGMRDASSGHIF